MRKITGVVLQDGKRISADAVIVATGGISYRTTGSTGDGYRFAKAAGTSGDGVFAVPGADGDSSNMGGTAAGIVPPQCGGNDSGWKKGAVPGVW